MTHCQRHRLCSHMTTSADALRFPAQQGCESVFLQRVRQHHRGGATRIWWRYRRGVRSCFAFLLVALTTPSLHGGDWPQILGPSRNGQAVDEELANSWDSNKPTRSWSVDVGQGYAGPAVRDSKVLIFHRQGNEEVLTCVNRSGKDLWTAAWPTSYRSRIDRDAGPRCVPVIHRDAVFVFGAEGKLHCASLENGRKLWSRNLAREYQAQDGYFGAGSSPLVVGDELLVNVGGRRSGAGIVALNLETGKTEWTALEDHASYSAPILRTSSQKQSAIFITRMHLLELDPSDGKIVFDLPFGKEGPTVNAASPLLLDQDRLFVTASYGIGAKLISLANRTPEVVWESDATLSSQYPTPVYHDGYVYGVHGREDGAPAELRCIDPRTGGTQWKKPGFGMAHLIIADEKLLAQQTEGELLLLELNSNSYRELGRVRLTNHIARAQPALANGQFYLRDTDGKLLAWRLP